MHVRALKRVFAVALLIGIGACGAPPRPAGPADRADQREASVQPGSGEERGSTKTEVTAGDLALVVGGNAARARFQMAWDDSVTFADVSGQERDVVDEADWKICTQEPPVGTTLVLGVVRTGEQC